MNNCIKYINDHINECPFVILLKKLWIVNSLLQNICASYSLDFFVFKQLAKRDLISLEVFHSHVTTKTEWQTQGRDCISHLAWQPGLTK